MHTTQLPNYIKVSVKLAIVNLHNKALHVLMRSTDDECLNGSCEWHTQGESTITAKTQHDL